MHELILGGQRSGKSRRAEDRAVAWLDGATGRKAVLVATALPGDDEMRRRIERHQADRARRVPRLQTEAVPVALAEAIVRLSDPRRLVVVDCLTLWLTQILLPPDGCAADAARASAAADSLDAALDTAPGPVVLVSNEIGLGVTPLTAQARHVVDELGRLHQRLAARCAWVTLMVAGLELAVKREST